ncbi:MAG: transpeptidase family protein [Bacteroidales bacterium]|nr:transpeptidase family protein [Bacteroidales bacterium]
MKEKATPRNDQQTIFSKAFLVWLGGVVLSLLIFYSLIKIKFFEKHTYIEKSKLFFTVREETVPAMRGNIYASDGTLLATSSPRYDIYIDFKAIDSSLWKDSISILCDSLAKFFKKRYDSKKLFQDLSVQKKKGNRYYKLADNVSFYEMRRLSRFPIFNKGKFKGGFIVENKSSRELMFGELAKRTIGYKIDKYYVGLEGAFDEVLRGIEGKRLIKRVAPNTWLPLSENTEIKPIDGKDILTTIDINLQEITHNALYNHLKKQKAHHGCAVVMEVKTGEIKAIVNLTRMPDSSYAETYNYAIGEGYEPGSTFKLISLMVALDDQKIKPEDILPTGNGQIVFRDKKGNIVSILKDAHEGGYGNITIKQAFELSSNVGIAMAIMKAYGKNPSEFVEKIAKKYDLLSPLNLEILGEAKPYMVEPGKSGWSNLISLPWLSIGYGVKLSPIHLLTFYNAIANDGVMVKPRFVKAFLSREDTIKKFQPVILKSPLCKPATVEILRSFMEGVVEQGTAQVLKKATFKIAGKTATAQISRGGKYKEAGSAEYYASFVGYFPADTPIYSCIVVVNRPSAGEYYGGTVAAPVFLEIADKIYTYMNQLMVKKTTVTSMPKVSAITSYKKLSHLFSMLGWQISYPIPQDIYDYVNVNSKTLETILPTQSIRKKILPSLIGLKAQDAIDVLEKLNCTPVIEGKGEVVEQFPFAGTTVYKNMKVTLKLK